MGRTLGGHRSLSTNLFPIYGDLETAENYVLYLRMVYGERLPFYAIPADSPSADLGPQPEPFLQYPSTPRSAHNEEIPDVDFSSFLNLSPSPPLHCPGPDLEIEPCKNSSQSPRQTSSLIFGSTQEACLIQDRLATPVLSERDIVTALNIPRNFNHKLPPTALETQKGIQKGRDPFFQPVLHSVGSPFVVGSCEDWHHLELSWRTFGVLTKSSVEIKVEADEASGPLENFVASSQDRPPASTALPATLSNHDPVQLQTSVAVSDGSSRIRVCNNCRIKKLRCKHTSRNNISYVQELRDDAKARARARKSNYPQWWE